MTFGSFIGYSAGFALAIKVVFGFKHIEVDGVLTHDIATPTDPRRSRSPGWDRSSVPSSGPSAGGSPTGRRRPRDPLGVDRHDAERARRGLLPARGVPLRDPRGLLRTVLPALPRAVRRQRNRQRIDLPHDRRRVRQGAGRARFSDGHRPSPRTERSWFPRSSAPRSTTPRPSTP